MQKFVVKLQLVIIRGMVKAKKPPKKRAVQFRVRFMMLERNVRSVSELSRHLEDIGVSISVSQLGRLIDGKSTHWSQEILEGLMTVLNCELSDLVR